MKKILIAILAVGLAACGKPADKAARPAAAKRGDPAPQVSVQKFLRGDLKDMKGWEDFKGKAVVLEFWGTYCEPCRENIPHLNELAEKYKDKPVVFLSLSKEPQATVEEFLKDTEMKGNVAAEAREAFKSFAVRGIPHTVLVDKAGVLRGFAYPSHVTAETLDALLSGSPAIPGIYVDKPEKDGKAG